MASLSKRLAQRLSSLSAHQLECVGQVVTALQLSYAATTAPDSDFATTTFAAEFADLLKIHHFFSEQPFTKDKFEYGLVRVLRRCGHRAEKANRGNPGQDISVNDEKWSLKTQADAGIRIDEIYISKFMELGRGVWDTETDLIALRQRMFTHLESYARIFTLRCLSAARRYPQSLTYEYELVEIPKLLLQQAAHFPLTMMQGSRQSPKPGYCVVTDAEGSGLFQLYFDGGTERKLQIKQLQKRACRVHASWKFSLPSPLQAKDS
jgi:type II restriction enzyme